MLLTYLPDHLSPYATAVALYQALC